MPHAKRKVVRKPIPARKVAVRKPQLQRAHTQSIVVRAPGPKPWELQPEEVTIVKNALCKGASDAELQFCLAVARRHKLDPFRGQIWFVKRKDSSAEGGHRWIPIVGIGGMLHIAARDHKDFGSNDEPEFGPMKEVKWSYYEKNGKIQAPEWAKVKLWKKGHEHPVVATVFWEEIYPDVGAAPLVRQMPRLMLGKCALAQAIRRAYPATDGLYIKEEFQGPPDFTPGGRLVTPAEPENKYLTKFEEREKEQLSKLAPSQQAIADKRIAEIEERKKALGYTLKGDVYHILGSADLKKKHWDLLEPLHSPVLKTAIATPEQLGHLIAKFEDRKQPFKNLDMREPGME